MCKLCVYKSFNHALLESKISGTISFAQWWVLDLTLETLFYLSSNMHCSSLFDKLRRDRSTEPSADT